MAHDKTIKTFANHGIARAVAPGDADVEVPQFFG